MSRRPFSSNRGRRRRPRFALADTECSAASSAAYCSRGSTLKSSSRIGSSVVVLSERLVPWNKLIKSQPCFGCVNNYVGPRLQHIILKVVRRNRFEGPGPAPVVRQFGFRAPIWSAPPRSATRDFCMRGGAFSLRSCSSGFPARYKSAATHAKVTNAERGGAVQMVAALSPCARVPVVCRHATKAPPQMRESANAEMGGALQICGARPK